MSGDNEDDEDKTEAPTARRQQQAREEGQVPLSREFVLLAGLAGVTIAFSMNGSAAGEDLVRRLSAILSQPDAWKNDYQALFHATVSAFWGAVAAIALPAGLAAIAVTLAQTQFSFRAKALTPDFSRISPGQGLSRLFSMNNLLETLKSLAKLTMAGLSVTLVLRDQLPRLAALPHARLGVLPGLLATIVTRLFMAVVLTQAVIAAADLVWVWYQHLQRLRMSRTGLRNEMRDTEGNPQIKMRIRRIRMRRARQRMMQAVPKATVVVTNPTHYAAALTYDSARSTVPILVAKGVDTMAARIRETARAHGVPVVQNPPLARTLYQLPLDARIPPELYKTVAELIAYVWRLTGKRG